MTPVVIVVEDDKNIRSLIVEVLAGGGYASLPLDTGEAAVVALKTARPAALIIDLQLRPPLSGWDVLARLEQDSTFSSMPTLVCSGDAWALRERSPELHAHGYGILEKPFDVEDLLRWLSSSLGPPIPPVSGDTAAREHVASLSEQTR